MVLVDTFNSKLDSAQLISILENNNIPYIQKSEDAGGKLAPFYLASGVKIYVSENDINKVTSLLADYSN